MNNTEFYVPLEDWPQPSEEKCTLESIKITAQSKKKKKSDTSKAKKKMSESLAGVTAAAVTVVMLSTSIPALPTIPVFEEIVIDVPDYGWSETCLVCQQEECPYFNRGYSGLQISLGTVDYTETYELYDPEDLQGLYDPADLEALGDLQDPEEFEALYNLHNLYGAYDDFYTMQGFILHRPYEQAPIDCVETDDGQRCVLRLTNSFSTDLYHNNWCISGWRTIHSSDSADISYSGLFYPLTKTESSPAGDTVYYDASSSATDYIYAVISYDKTGENRFVDPYIYLDYIPPLDSDIRPYNYVTRDIPGVSNAQLQLVSSLDITEFYELLEYCNVTVVETKDQVFDLGKTMRFAETASVYRTYSDLETSSSSYNYSFFEGAPGDFLHSLTYVFPFKSYSIGTSSDIILSDVGWNNILDLIFDLNQTAPETGHQAFFPAVELNSCTVNNITYRCYLLYHEETYYNTYDALCFMVPLQESEVAIRFEASLSAEQLETLLDTLDPATAFEISDLLNQITLR